MAAASDERTAAAVERAAGDEIARALAADERAAARAAERLPARVATLSRSGTVHAALRRADPDAVLVAESHPGREGVDTAERLARETTADVTIATDAAFAGALADADCEALVVGADAVLPDGSVLNKVGTRGATAAAAREELECLVVAAGDKVLPADGNEDGPARVDREERDPAAVYDGPADVAVANPTFDLTPADRIDAVVTEDGVLDAADVREVAQRHRDRTDWD
jgi:translation initiation factor 2B subunit (eIF-2B alpha/beta/delta family)